MTRVIGVSHLLQDALANVVVVPGVRLPTTLRAVGALVGHACRASERVNKKFVHGYGAGGAGGAGSAAVMFAFNVERDAAT